MSKKATLLADIVSSVEALAADGRPAAELVSHLMAEADRRRLSPIGRVGDHMAFDKSLHEPADRRQPKLGQEVRIARSGFTWTGTGRSIVVVKALVE